MATVELAREQLLIGGRWTDADGGRTFEQTFPYTGETAAPRPRPARGRPRRGRRRARGVPGVGDDRRPASAARSCSEAADLLLERAEQIAEIVTEETGGIFGWGMFNCVLASGMLREAAAQTYGLIGEVIPSDVPGKLAMAVRQPAGVVVGIAPWNAPVILVDARGRDPARVRQHRRAEGVRAVPAHARGGRRTRSPTPGVPAGVINFITNAPADAADVVDELIAHPATRRVNFTGSTRVGRIIAEIAGRHLKRVLLELGGKAPLVVLPDADLERAAAATSFGAFFHQGQICMSTERIVVDRGVAERSPSGSPRARAR